MLRITGKPQPETRNLQLETGNKENGQTNNK